MKTTTSTSVRVCRGSSGIALNQMFRLVTITLTLAFTLSQTGCLTRPGLSGDAKADLNAEAAHALKDLYATRPAAKTLGRQAKAVLIFPDILKGGFMFGGQMGNGVLRQGSRTVGYYNTTAASYGLQAGLQKFGYVLFFMSDAALEHLNDTGGWEIGVGPSIVVVDEGMARSLTTTTLHPDIYAFIFNQTGLMAGLGLQGSKITEIEP